MHVCLNLNVCCKGQHAKIVRPRSVLLTFHLNHVFALACVLGPENLRKNHAKRHPNTQKFDLEKYVFFDVDFYGFGARFSSLFGSQVGLKFAQNRMVPLSPSLLRANV